MPEKERGLRRRRNAGQDASGTHRNIARDVLPPPEMLSGMRISHENPWRFVLGCLSIPSGSVDPAPRLKILDIVVMDGSGGGQAENFFFTGMDGTLQRKPQRSLSLKTIEKELRSKATGSKKRVERSSGRRDTTLETGEHVVAMARRRNGEYLPLTSEALHTLVKAGSLPGDFECLNPFKRAKDFDTTAAFANYQHQYMLDDTGGGISAGVTHRRVPVKLSGNGEDAGGGGIPLVIRGSGKRCHNLLLSKNATLNAEAVATTRSVVLAIERAKPCRVLRLDTEFVFDEDDELWLVGVNFCKVAARQTPNGAPQESTDPHGTRKEEDRVLATEMRSRKHRADETSEVLPDENFKHLLRRIGYASTTKRRARGRKVCHGRRPPSMLESTRRSAATAQEADNGDGNKTLAVGSVTGFHAVGVSNTDQQQGSALRAVDSPGIPFDLDFPEFFEKCTTKNLARDATGGGSAVNLSPSPSRSTREEGFDSSVVELDSAATNRIYGSTQLEGCRGDFCEFDVSQRVREEEAHTNFVEKVARAAGAANGLIENLSPLRLKIISMENEDPGDGALGSLTAGVVKPGGRGPRAARHSDTNSELLDIPYKAVVQARQERPLVEAFLRRYARGEDGDYHRYLDGGHRDEPYLVGGKYPGVYYRSVKVCSNCHMVYTLVDEARFRALQKARRGEGAGRGVGRRQRRTARVLGSNQSACESKGAESTSSAEALPAAYGEGVDRDRGADNAFVEESPGLAISGPGGGHEHSLLTVSLAEARRAMDAISQGDISELRSLVRPPAAVEHVTSIALSLLEEASINDKTIAASSSWVAARAAMCRGDFLSKLRTLDPRSVTRQQISAVMPALGRSNLDPAVVRPLCNAAGNICLWILGVIQAHHWLTGSGHSRANTVPAEDDIRRWGHDLGRRRGTGHDASVGVLREQPFPQQRSRAGRLRNLDRTRWGSPPGVQARRKRDRAESRTDIEAQRKSNKCGRAEGGSVSLEPATIRGLGVVGPATASPTLAGRTDAGFGVAADLGSVTDTDSAPTPAAVSSSDRSPRRRRKRAGERVAAQAFASDRLAHGGQSGLPEAASAESFLCSDGRSRFPYRVCGNPGGSSAVTDSCNFIVVHDIFDNVDKTEVLFRPITRRHRGCRVLAFSYPGQAGTVFRVPPSMATVALSGSKRGLMSLPNRGGSRSGGGGSGGGDEPHVVRNDVPNNAFIAPRLHELLQHIHSVGKMSLTAPFHLVGIGNGMATAAAFALSYGDHPLYRSSLRSVVSINGFSSVDSQLAAILHSSLNAFATLPPTRPDLPVSFMSRYMFSEEYLEKVGRNLALGISTAVANPISLEGRHLLCSSALLHENLSAEVGTLGVPIVLLQSTEDVLVNPANVDPFLRGRSSTHHFWSHEFRDGVGDVAGGGDVDTSSIAPMSQSSVYGRKGIIDLLRALSKPRGTFVAWVRAGHEVCQEGKRAVIDLLDALAKPTPGYTGVSEADVLLGEPGGSATVGLYPSGQWVARVNRQGDRQAKKNGELSPRLGTGADTASATTPDMDDDGDSEERVPAKSVNCHRRDGRDLHGRGGNDADDHETRDRVGPVAGSPFPRDISIPTLPASIALPHRGLNTSPIKRSNPATCGAGITAADAGRGARHTVEGHSGGRNQSRRVDAFGFTNEEDTDRNGGAPAIRHGKPRGRDASGALFRDPGAINRTRLMENDRHLRVPKVVWKDSTPPMNVSSEHRARDRGDKDGRRREGESRSKDYSTSFFPEAALVYDDRSTPSSIGGSREGESCHRSTVPLADGSMNATLTPSRYDDPWDLINNPPSLELLASGQLQRGNRRWVVEKENAATASRSRGENDGSLGSSVPPADLITTTEATAGSTCPNLSREKDAGGAPPQLRDLLEAEASLESRLCEARRLAGERLLREQAEAERRIAGITEEQQARSRAFAQQDREMIAELEAQLAAGRLGRAPTDLQRAVDGVGLDDAIVREGLVPSVPLSSAQPECFSTRDCDGSGPGGSEGTRVGRRVSSSPARAMPPLDYSPLEDLPEELQRATDAYSVMDDAARDESEMLRIRKAAGDGGGPMNLEQFQRDQAAAASEAAAWRLTSKKAFRKRSESELERARVEAALRLQPLARGVLGRKRARRLRLERDEIRKLSAAAIKVQTVARGYLAKTRARVVREKAMDELVLGGSALRLQSVGRGMLGRRQAARRRRQVVALTIQRCYRGHLGRRSAARKRAMLEHLRERNRAAVVLQAWWRCRVAVDGYARARATSIAAIEIQRCFRGMIGRKKVSRRLEWEKAKPGPERLKLGVRLIEDSKAAFEAQRVEIAALHTAGERAVTRTSRIRRELGTSEKELMALEREMHEIDHIEGELAQLSHQREKVQLGLVKAGETMQGVDTPAPSVSGMEEATSGRRGGSGNTGSVNNEVGAADQELGFALEMQIQIKRAEREKKRQELEADFRGVREEVDHKRRELERVTSAITGIECTRERKTAEFRRMQANLMELLREQKMELDSVKEKGIQLEVATATSAAAATATAQRAKEHEERSSAIYSQTEELMKFQFMSMSLSYFSSLSMLKTMRGINADTTTAAVTSSADAAAAAAASAAAASLPGIKADKVLEPLKDVVGQEIGRKKKILQEKMDAQEEMDEANAHPFPNEVKFWTKEDVGLFLVALGLQKYRPAFEEAAVDGDFLLALDPNDCADVLGVEHPLHSKKLFLAIDKLRPMTERDRRKKAAVEREEFADTNRGDDPPDVETVFSQVRNGRLKRLEDSLEKGFLIDTEDEHGNTALMVACQNCNVQLCEMLLRRGADVNHQNGRGNTALHYAMAYDTQGVLGEMLISRGGDDTAANKDGLSCYDGLGGPN